MDWDGLVIMEVESVEKFLEVGEDEEFKRVVIPDETRFFDRSAGVSIFAADVFTVVDK
jgi:hypothetical protein